MIQFNGSAWSGSGWYDGPRIRGRGKRLLTSSRAWGKRKRAAKEKQESPDEFSGLQALRDGWLEEGSLPFSSNTVTMSWGNFCTSCTHSLKSQVSGIALWGCSLKVVVVIVNFSQIMSPHDASDALILLICSSCLCHCICLYHSLFRSARTSWITFVRPPARPWARKIWISC